MKRILLTTIHRPLGVESETCTENIQVEMYHAQVTLAQGPFSIRSVCTGWGQEFIAANLDAPTTVLHYPTERRFIHELKKGYDFVGIGFVICTFPKAIELCKIAKRVSPKTKIVLGGYGTVLGECDQYADYVCREEGVAFFKRLLGESTRARLISPPIIRRLKVLSITTRPEAIIAIGLGCSRGCEFCCTSHFYDRQHIPLLKTGREIHEAMCSAPFQRASFRNIGVIDEDFLADRNRIDEMIPLNAAEIDKPILFSCLTSLKSIAQYTIDELLSMGLAGVWVGIESRRAQYDKLKGLNAHGILDQLKQVGIIPLTSMIIGYDWHDERTIEEDFQYLWSLRPAFSQLMIYSPCPGTPLYEQMQKKGRLRSVPYKNVDGFHALFEHPYLSTERLESLVKEFFRREYEELGPSVCRVLEIELQGYKTLCNHPNTLFRIRAREYKKFCLEIYPLLKTAIRRAPSEKVQRTLRALKEEVEETFKIPLTAIMKEAAVPFLAMYTDVKDHIFPHPQPPTLVHQYRSSSLGASADL
jgi:radical SAM superfamily enzyme YgiQ (UPF0313 family)